MEAVTSVTLQLGTKRKPREVARDTLVDTDDLGLDEGEVQRLFDRGFLREPGEGAAHSNVEDGGERLDLIQEAIGEVDLKDSSNVTGDGRPTVEAVQAEVVKLAPSAPPVTAPERDAAWAALQAD